MCISDQYVKRIRLVKAHKDFYAIFQTDAIFKGIAGPVILCFVYHPPPVSFYREDNLLSGLLLNDLLFYTEGGNIPVIFCGDVNGRSGNLQAEQYKTEFPRLSSDPVINSRGRSFIQFCETANLVILNGTGISDNNTLEFTFANANGASTIDYVAVSYPIVSCINSYKLHHFRVESQHRPYVLALNMHANQNMGKATNVPGTHNAGRVQPPRFIWNPACNIDMQNFVAAPHLPELTQQMYNSISNLETSNAVALIAEKILIEVSNKYLKKTKGAKSKTFPVNPWFGDECKRAKSEAHIAAKEANNDNTEYNIKLKAYRRTVQRDRRRYQADTLATLETMDERKDVLFWREAKKLNPKKSLLPLTADDCLQGANDAAALAANSVNFDRIHEQNIKAFLNDYFSADNIPSHMHAHLNDIFNPLFEMTELNCACKRLNSDSASGVDGIPGEVVKIVVPNQAKFLELFNYVFASGDYPERWIEGFVTPVYKNKGPKTDYDSYRPITVISSIGKVFEAMLQNRIQQANMMDCFEDDNNNGFRRMYRTSDNLLYLDCCIRRQRQAGKSLYIALIDFKSAFNIINHDFLLYKLLDCGVDGRFLRILKSMYTKAKSCFKVNGMLSDYVNLITGVNQGSIISPQLFKKFFRDLAGVLRQELGLKLNAQTYLYYLLWADDLILLAENPEDLQAQLDILHAYCNKWHVLINPSKTKTMVFRPLRRKRSTLVDPTPILHIDNVHVEMVEQAIYLGVMINSKYQDPFKTHVDYAIKKANQAVGKIYSCFKNVGSLPPSLALKCFDTQVMPVLRYACEIYYKPCMSSSVEKVQLQYLRSILGVKSSTSSIAVRGEYGRFPLDLDLRTHCYKYLFHLREEVSDNSLLAKIRDSIVDSHITGHDTWLKTLESNIAVKITSPAIINSLLVRKNFLKWKRDLYEDSQCAWNEAVANSEGTLRTYRRFKSHMRLEPYLTQVKDYGTRRALAKFRLSSHPLAIEKGRHKNPPLPPAERFCPDCPGVVEDEQHFLLKCGKFRSARANLIADISIIYPGFTSLTEDEQFVKLMKCPQPHMLVQIGKFIRFGFGMR